MTKLLNVEEVIKDGKDAVEKKDCGVEPLSRRGIEYGEEPTPLARDENAVHIRAMSPVPIMGLLSLWLFLHVRAPSF